MLLVHAPLSPAPSPPPVSCPPIIYPSRAQRHPALTVSWVRCEQMGNA